MLTCELQNWIKLLGGAIKDSDEQFCIQISLSELPLLIGGSDLSIRVDGFVVVCMLDCSEAGDDWIEGEAATGAASHITSSV